MRHLNKKNSSNLLVTLFIIVSGILLPGNLLADSVFKSADTTLAYPTAVATNSQKETVSPPIILSGNYVPSSGIVFRYLNVFANELAEDNSSIWNNESRFQDNTRRPLQANWMYSYVILNGEKKQVRDIMSEQAMAAGCRAFAGVFNTTRLGKKIKKIEQKISKYFVVEFSKNKSDEIATFYAPGELDLSERKADKEYAVSLSSSFYTDTDSINGDYSLELDAFYHDYRLFTEYNVSSKKTKFLVENSALNSLLGASASLSMVKENNQPLAGSLNITWIL